MLHNMFKGVVHITDFKSINKDNHLVNNIIPDDVIHAGVLALDNAKIDCKYNIDFENRIDWDQAMIVEFVYNCMTAKSMNIEYDAKGFIERHSGVWLDPMDPNHSSKLKNMIEKYNEYMKNQED